MNDKILFMILGDEIKFLPKESTMDHREWYQSIGGDMSEYENIIRGYVIENYLVFFKANLNYDSDVIDVATICGPVIKQQLNRPDLKVCCGINPGQDGRKWEPIVMLKGYGLEAVTGKNNDKVKSREEEMVVEEIEQKKEPQIEKLSDDVPPEPLIEFFNDFTDPEFIKYATKFNIIILVVSIITKLILFATKNIMPGDRWSTLLIIVETVSLILSTVLYNQKNPKAKYVSLVAAISLFFMFDIIDIILGILVLFFTIDQTYIMKLMDFINKYKKIILDKIKESKSKKGTKNNNSKIVPEQNQIPNVVNTTPENLINMYGQNNQNQNNNQNGNNNM